MSNRNTPSGSEGGLKKFFRGVIPTTSKVQQKIAHVLGDQSLTGAMFDAVGDLNQARKKGMQDSKGTIENYLQQSSNQRINNITLEDITLPEGVSSGEYRSHISRNWGTFILAALGKSIKAQPLKKQEGRKSQIIKKLIQESLPQSIHNLALEGYKKNGDFEDYDDTVFYKEIQSVQDIFRDTLNIILRINVMLDNEELGKLVTRLLDSEQRATRKALNFDNREITRIAFLIQVLESGTLEGIISSKTLGEILNIRLHSLQIESQCVHFGRLGEGDDEGESEADIEAIYGELNAQAISILQNYSEFYTSITLLKKKTQSMHLEREAIGNLLDIKVSEVVAKKIFDEENPLYHLIFKNTYTDSKGKPLFLKTSSEFKTFLLRLITKFPKISYSDESGKEFSIFYKMMLHLDHESTLTQEKQNKILRFLNSLKNPERDLDFCIFVILCDIEDIDIMLHLTHEDRDFIARNFDIGLGQNIPTLQSIAKILAGLRYSDLCRMRSLSPDELSIARQDIESMKEIFRKERTRDTLHHDLLWLPENTAGYQELESLLNQDITLQDQDELSQHVEEIYREHDISNFVRTHRVILSEIDGAEAVRAELRQISVIYQAIASHDNHFMRAFIQEVYRLTSAERTSITKLMSNQGEEFDYTQLLGNISELLVFTRANNFVDEDLGTIWELFQLEHHTDTISPEKQETDTSIFIEIFGEDLGLRISVLDLPQDTSDRILKIGSTLSSSHTSEFVDFIESRKIFLKKQDRETMSKLDKLLIFSVLVSNNSLHTLTDITKYYQEIWNLDPDSTILTEISDILDEVRVHGFPELGEYLYLSLLEADTTKLQKYIRGATQGEEQITQGEKEHIKLSSTNPGEVVRKLERLEYTRIKTRSGHNKYRGVNRNGDKVMIILPVGKGDVNKYILRQIVNITGLSTLEWQEL